MDERVNAKAYISYFTSQRGITVADLGVAPAVVVSWHRKIAESLAHTNDLQLSKHWIYGELVPLYFGKVNDQQVSVVRLPVGAPATVTVMEEMIACGARVFVGLGLTGSLQPEAPVGTYVIPTSCVREEGTSIHYVGSDAVVGPSLRLVKALQAACKAEGVRVLKGTVWTTDAPYRELSSKIDTYRGQGILGVDMETSAMYALGQFRGVEICNLLVVSDELWKEWNPAFFSQELQKAIEGAERVVQHCLAKGLGQQKRM
jgi:uridine phosphorylase